MTIPTIDEDDAGGGAPSPTFRFPRISGATLLPALWVGVGLQLFRRLHGKTRTAFVAAWLALGVAGAYHSADLIWAATSYSGTKTNLLVESFGSNEIQAVKLVNGRIDWGNTTTGTALNAVSTNGSIGSAIDAAGKSDCIFKIEFATAGASASVGVMWGDWNASQGWTPSTENWSSIATNAAAAQTTTTKASHYHGNYLRIPNPGFKDIKLFLVDASQLQSGTVSAWGVCS